MKAVLLTLTFTIVIAELFQCVDAELNRQKTPIRTCRNTEMKGHQTFVKLGACSGYPCVIHRGGYFDWVVEFQSNVNFKNARVEVGGTLMNYNTFVSFAPMSTANACGKYMRCPVQRGSLVQYKRRVHVSPSYPKVLVLAEWKLFSEKNELIVCFTVPVKIV